MLEFENIDQALTKIEQEALSIVYVSMQGCSVCVAVKPQLINRYADKLPILHLDAAALPEVAGTFQVMTAPAVLVFSHGKEMLRQARFIDYLKIDKLVDEFKEVAPIDYEELFK